MAQEPPMSDASDRLLQILRGTFLSEVRLDQPDLSMRQLAVAWSSTEPMNHKPFVVLRGLEHQQASRDTGARPTG